MPYRQRITRVKADMVIIIKGKITRAKVIKEEIIKEVVHKVDTRIMMVKEIRVIEIPINQGETIEETMEEIEEIMEEIEETMEEISLPEVTL